MIAAPRDPHEEEQARLQENLFYTNLSSLQPKTNAKFWLNRYEVNDRLNGMLRRFFNVWTCINWIQCFAKLNSFKVNKFRLQYLRDLRLTISCCIHKDT